MSEVPSSPENTALTAAGSGPLRWPVFLLFFFATAAVLSFQHRDFYFHRPVVAWGDFAANERSIRDAGNLHEIHGNYSRWRFHHPGPAFFYAEAAGERLFYRWSKICPAPHNAHVFSSMLVQAAFWALALTILASYISAAPVALIWLAGWIHLHATGHAFVSAWPPHVLLLPFFCFAVAAASVASGQLGHLWILLLSGLMLIHGHIAQALSVAAIGTCALAGVLWQKRLGLLRGVPGGPEFRWWVALCAVPTGLLILPLVLDLFLGADSNLHAVLTHMERYRGDTKTVAQSINYLLEFSRYWGFHDVPAATFLGDFLQQPMPLLLWAGLLILFIARSLSPWQTPAEGARAYYREFLRALFLVFCVALVCALIWGVRMNGDMFAFNGFYYYAIYLLVVVGACCAIADWIAFHSRFLRVSIYAAAIIVPWMLPGRSILSDIPHGADLEQRVISAQGKTELPTAQPILLLHAGDRSLEAVSLANVLEEHGSRLAVPRSAAYLFGWRSSIERFSNPSKQPFRILSVVAQPPPANTPSTDLGDGIAYLTEIKWKISPAAFPWETHFDRTFSAAASGLVADGDYPPWSVGYDGDLILPILETTQDVRLHFEVHALAGLANSAPRRIVFQIEGQPDVQMAVSGQQDLEFVVPKKVWNQHFENRGCLLIHMLFPNPISPRDCGINDDPRLLSISFHRLRIDAAAPVR